MGEKYTTGQYGFPERSKFHSISIIIENRQCLCDCIELVGMNMLCHTVCTNYIYMNAVYTNETYSDNLTYAYTDYRKETWCINAVYMIHQSHVLFPRCLCWCCIRE